MSTTIICPNCTHQFEPTDAIAQSIEKEIRSKMEVEWRKRLDGLNAEKQQLEQQQKDLDQRRQQQDEELKRRLDTEKKLLAETLSQEIKKSVGEDYEGKVKHFQQLISEKDEKIKKVQAVELEALQLKEKLASQEQEMDLRLKRALIEERERLQELLKKEEEERGKLRELEHQMKVRELEKQLEDQRLLAEEMKRKAEQGSMQLQGEVQELMLEEMLRNAFPFDLVSEVGKGIRGADSILTVRNGFGQECGKIVFESKRTKDFSNEWIEKTKADMRSLGADMAVIVTQAMPKGMDTFGEKDSVWICGFNDVRALTSVLRDMVIKVFNAVKSNENKGDKMTLLYDYLTGKEFSEQWKAMREGFVSMRMSIIKEREQMEKLWKVREKQLDKVLLSATHIKGSIEGISGTDVDLNLIEDSGDGYLIE
jgi:hypothetical protein